MLEYTDKLVEPAKILIAIGMAITLALTVLFLIAGPDSKPLPGAAALASKSNGIASVSVEDIAALNLFGDATRAVAKVVQDAAAELERTTLKLELIGIFAAFDDDEGKEVSVALIAEKNRQAKDYKVNDQLPGGAKLVEIHADRVVLSRGGKREQLPFHDLSLIEVTTEEPRIVEAPTRQRNPRTRREPPAPSPEPVIADDGENSMRRVVATYEKRLTDDPEGTLKSLGVQPVSTGSAAGYRLGTLAAHPALRQTGLQAGDVLLSVNSRPVGDVSADRLEIASVMAQGSARLEVKRGTRRFFVTVSLK